MRMRDLDRRLCCVKLSETYRERERERDKREEKEEKLQVPVEQGIACIYLLDIFVRYGNHVCRPASIEFVQTFNLVSRKER